MFSTAATESQIYPDLLFPRVHLVGLQQQSYSPSICPGLPTRLNISRSTPDLHSCSRISCRYSFFLFSKQILFLLQQNRVMYTRLGKTVIAICLHPSAPRLAVYTHQFGHVFHYTCTTLFFQILHIYNLFYYTATNFITTHIYHLRMIWLTVRVPIEISICWQIHLHSTPSSSMILILDTNNLIFINQNCSSMPTHETP
jgi:hypothetical protein